jgi:predicted O-linked N-acetylglucosamine transferase (SPINDLY family)
MKELAFYEQAIAENLDDRTLYWHYGLALLLDRQEEEAQGTWLMVLAEAEEQEALWRSELEQVLETAATQQAQTGDNETAWLIRQHRREINPTSIENLLQLLALTILNQALSLETFDELNLLEALGHDLTQEINDALLFNVVEKYLAVAIAHPITVDFVKAVLPYVTDRRAFVDLVAAKADVIGYVRNYAQLASALIAVLLDCFPQDFELLLADCIFKQKQDDHAATLTAAQTAFGMASTIVEKITASRAVIQALLAGGQQDTAFKQHCDRHNHLLQDLLQSPPSLDLAASYRMMISTMHLPYIEDAPAKNRALQNQIMALCETSIQRHHQVICDRYQATHLEKKLREGKTDRPLKVGYLCRYFYQHSVGWLARWLLKNHNPQNVELYVYIINPQSTPDSVQQQYRELPANIRGCPLDAVQIATTIHQDDLDILVELDSLTCQVTCEVMAIKPAPIQVSWLGWDAMGMSSIDYFIADPYVLPDDAQDYYVEKIVQLPQTYIAVEGFEIGVPTLHRQQLGIPTDAIIYLSAQRGYKRHPDMMRRQMEILQQVPNSYLLIKGLADQAVIQALFSDLAASMAIDTSRLRFLPIVDSEEVHRANLAIADVILDTYPYNGATTTLEALWLERPLVTQVGSQFTARNSYTMLKNVGIEIGIAWTDREYVEWGVKLGIDESLRQRVSQQLKEAKRSAPLWQVKLFTEQVETAYRKMWTDFITEPRSSHKLHQETLPGL